MDIWHLFARSENPVESEKCPIHEKKFENQCNQGYYDARNVHVLSLNGDTVKFQLTQPFLITLSQVAVWFESPTEDSEDYCYYSDSVATGLFDHDFEAKCTDGWARVSMYGGHKDEKKPASFQQLGVEDLVPISQCQLSQAFSLPEFNPNKRCYWEFKIPCSCGENGDGRRLTTIGPTQYLRG